MERARDLPEEANGFTLVEVVIALSILSILMIGLVMGLRTGLSALERGEARAEQIQRLRSLVRMFNEEISSIEPLQVLLQGERTYALYAKAGAFGFVTTSPQGSAEHGGLALVKYEATRGKKGRWTLTRSERPLLMEGDPVAWLKSAQEGSALLEEANEVRFSYHRRRNAADQTQEQWMDQFDPQTERGLPDSVMIRIETSDPTDLPLTKLRVPIHAVAEASF